MQAFSVFNVVFKVAINFWFTYELYVWYNTHVNETLSFYQESLQSLCFNKPILENFISSIYSFHKVGIRYFLQCVLIE